MTTKADQHRTVMEHGSQPILNRLQHAMLPIFVNLRHLDLRRRTLSFSDGVPRNKECPLHILINTDINTVWVWIVK